MLVSSASRSAITGQQCITVRKCTMWAPADDPNRKATLPAPSHSGWGEAKLQYDDISEGLPDLGIRGIRGLACWLRRQSPAK